MSIITQKNKNHSYTIYGENSRDSSGIFILAIVFFVFVDIIFSHYLPVVLTTIITLILIGLMLKYLSKFVIQITPHEITFLKQLGGFTFLKWQHSIETIMEVNSLTFIINPELKSKTSIELLESFDDDCLLVKGHNKELRIGNEKSSKQIFESLRNIFEEYNFV